LQFSVSLLSSRYPKYFSNIADRNEFINVDILFDFHNTKAAYFGLGGCNDFQFISNINGTTAFVPKMRSIFRSGTRQIELYLIGTLERRLSEC
jgi:uncharacterized ParB-like nuclease family protein